jgi:hypothetical protein
MTEMTGNGKSRSFRSLTQQPRTQQNNPPNDVDPDRLASTSPGQTQEPIGWMERVLRLRISYDDPHKSNKKITTNPNKASWGNNKQPRCSSSTVPGTSTIRWTNTDLGGRMMNSDPWVQPRTALVAAASRNYAAAAAAVWSSRFPARGARRSRPARCLDDGRRRDDDDSSPLLRVAFFVMVRWRAQTWSTLLEGVVERRPGGRQQGCAPRGRSDGRVELPCTAPKSDLRALSLAMSRYGRTRGARPDPRKKGAICSAPRNGGSCAEGRGPVFFVGTHLPRRRWVLPDA